MHRPTVLPPTPPARGTRRQGYVAPPAGSAEQLPGATHGGDEAWLFASEKTKTDGERDLALDMARWFGSLARNGDPNTGANAGAPAWPAVGDTQHAPASAMFLGDTTTPLPRYDASVDTVRAECEHWKPFMGWNWNATSTFT